MATKLKLMKLLQEIRGFAQLTQRRPQPKPPGLFLLQLRSHVHHATLPRRRLTIPIQLHEPPDIPTPVKITFIGGDVTLGAPIHPESRNNAAQILPEIALPGEV